jgi:hypothetical protein
MVAMYKVAANTREAYMEKAEKLGRGLKNIDDFIRQSAPALQPWFYNVFCFVRVAWTTHVTLAHLPARDRSIKSHTLSCRSAYDFGPSPSTAS